MDLDKYKRKDFTHKLSCRHAIGTSGYCYLMDCIVLGKTKSGKIKIIVFGDRNWKRNKDKKRIRYVEYHRIFPRKREPVEAVRR